MKKNLVDVHVGLFYFRFGKWGGAKYQMRSPQLYMKLILNVLTELGLSFFWLNS